MSNKWAEMYNGSNDHNESQYYSGIGINPYKFGISGDIDINDDMYIIEKQEDEERERKEAIVVLAISVFIILILFL